jgi:hypothetical protein
MAAFGVLPGREATPPRACCSGLKAAQQPDFREA